jgi:hypothetical protein
VIVTFLVMASQVYTYLQSFQCIQVVYTLSMHTFLYINHTSNQEKNKYYLNNKLTNKSQHVIKIIYILHVYIFTCIKNNT